MSAEEYYSHVNFPIANTPGSSQAMRNEFELVETGFAKLPDLVAGAGKPVIVKADGTGMSAVDAFPDNTFGNVSTTAHGLAPKLPGSINVFLRGDGTWGGAGNGAIQMSSRTTMTQFVTGDSGTFIDITAGTFTQTFAACAVLSAGWYIFLRNNGTGDITLDPNGAELIDGLTSYIMYPGEVRFIQCDGTKLTSFVVSGFKKEFAASGNFIKPPGYSAFDVELWGAGAGGYGANTSNGSGVGGGGGGYFPQRVFANQLTSSTAVSIGAGGAGGIAAAGGTSGGNIGGVGGNSTFGGTLVTANGGSGASGGSGAGISVAPYVGATGTSTGISSGNGTAGFNSVWGGGSGGVGAGGSSPATGGNGGVRMGGTAAVGGLAAGANGAAFCGGAGGGTDGTTMYKGGDGGVAGGGGGGSFRLNVSGGNGGKGGDGYCIIRGVN